MNRKESLKTWLPVVFAALLAIAVFATGTGLRQRSWSRMVKTKDLVFKEEEIVDSRGEQARILVSRGPGLNLAAGTYRLAWTNTAAAPGRGSAHVTLGSAYGARISPAEFEIELDRESAEIELTLFEVAEDFQIRAVFEDEAALDGFEIGLYTPYYRDYQFTAAFALAALSAVWIAYRRKAFTPERCGRLLLIGFAVLLVCAPSFRDSLVMGHDGLFHMQRVENLRDSLVNGQIPARVGGFSHNGYGAVTSAFYPDILLYPFALLLIAGTTIQYALHLYQIALNVTAAWTMYVCAKRIFRDRNMATCAAVLYVLAVYRVANVYVRFDLGEATAMSLLPLFLLGLWEVVFGDKKRWRLLAVSAAGICQSHVLSTMMCVPFSLGVGALFIVRIVREGRLLSLIKALCTAGLLCAFWFVPFAMYSQDGIGAKLLRKKAHERAIAPGHLLLWGEGEYGGVPGEYAIPSFNVEIGLALLLGVLLVVYLFATEKEKRGRNMYIALLFAAAGSVAAVMGTTLFPWEMVRNHTWGYSDYLQFPWRFLFFTDALFALAGAFGYTHAVPERAKGKAAIIALTLSAVIALPSLGSNMHSDDYIGYGEGTIASQGFIEYQLPDTNRRDIEDRNWHAEGELTVTDYEKNGMNITAQVDAQGDSALSVPLFGFRGYAAEVDGQRLEWTLSGNNRLTVLLPAGTHGRLSVWFEGEAVWRIGDAVSLLTALVLIARALFRRRMVNRLKA